MQQYIRDLRQKAAEAIWSPSVTGDENVVRSLQFNVSLVDANALALSEDTCYNYSLLIHHGIAHIHSCSCFGAAYALEGLLQLTSGTSGGDGILPHSRIEVHDAPMYRWRGLMIDSGRRFFPVPLVENLLDTMAAVKLNVLHLHASDYCRWSVESKLYPNLTASLTGIRAGHYTQADIGHLVAYAKERGIRVVPEFDVPGHSRGLLPLEGDDAIHFCTDAASRSQLYDDPAKHTYGTVHSLVREMAALFPDKVFHLGADETAVKGRCPLESTLRSSDGWRPRWPPSLGRRRRAGRRSSLTRGRPPTRRLSMPGRGTGRRRSPGRGDARGGVVLLPFLLYRGRAGRARRLGQVLVRHLDGRARGERHLLLGGEMSMWSDTYCYTGQCGASTGTPVGAPLFPPARDAEFAASIGGMIWPRGFVGAAAFWGYNETADPASDEFTDAIWVLNDQLIKRGSKSCPSKCSCDQLSACGSPYIHPSDNEAPPRRSGRSSVNAQRKW